MHVTDAEIRRIEGLYGKPEEENLAFEMGPREWEILRRSQSHGRVHDVTLFVIRDGQLATIAKHPYPPGIFRAPSGGVLPGESMEEGIAREMMEETGLEVRLTRYVLRVRVEFQHRGAKTNWMTHVFAADFVSGEIAPLDLEEIREARWSPLSELAGTVRQALLASGSAGLRYRAWLHDRVMAILEKGS
ncbi:MAG TPA: NUDIX hydrolase [Candidatus Polarisedimenticolia bacterium]|jgi:ADP-ribose pyrophosphatase YjhB (NUDIX family)|nr:NUDIX hydrolase [Candidatus Polarisedimenticolia bacterium]